MYKYDTAMYFKPYFFQQNICQNTQKISFEKFSRDLDFSKTANFREVGPMDILNHLHKDSENT